MEKKFNLEIQKRLNNELWSAQIAAHVIQNSEMKVFSSESGLKRFKLYSLGSIAALFVAVISISGTFYFNDYFTTPDEKTNMVKSPSENLKKEYPEMDNNSILYDNLDNIIEASINMRSW